MAIELVKRLKSRAKKKEEKKKVGENGASGYFAGLLTGKNCAHTDASKASAGLACGTGGGTGSTGGGVDAHMPGLFS